MGAGGGGVGALGTLRMRCGAMGTLGTPREGHRDKLGAGGGSVGALGPLGMR